MNPGPGESYAGLWEDGAALFRAGAGQESIVNLQHEGCETGRHVSIDRPVTDPPLLPRAVFHLIFKQLTAEELVVFIPFVAAMVDHGLGIVIMVVEVGTLVAPFECRVFADVFDPGFGVSGCALAPHLIGKNATAGQSGASV